MVTFHSPSRYLREHVRTRRNLVEASTRTLMCSVGCRRHEEDNVHERGRLSDLPMDASSLVVRSRDSEAKMRI